MSNKFTVGTGVHTEAVEEFIKTQTKSHIPDIAAKDEPDQIEDAQGNVYILNSVGHIKFSTKPTVQGQFAKPKLWKFGEQRAMVYHLNNTKELKSYNALLKLASREDPGVQIDNVLSNFYAGEYVLLVTYRTILYLALTTKH